MTVLSVILPEVSKPDTTEDPKIVTALTTIQNWANGNVDSSNLKSQSIETGSLHAEAVTGPKLGAETLRLLAATAYTAIVPRAMNAKVLASATRPVWVMAIIGNGGLPPTTEWQILVGGVVIAKTNYPVATNDLRTVSFLVPPGVEWEPRTISGSFTCESSYLVL